MMLLSATLAQPAAGPNDRAGLEFFEKKVRPVLVQHCYECHSSRTNKAKGGLLLDSRDGVLKGGDSGPALVPGSPEKSLLIKAVKYDGVKMPPKSKGQLPKEIIADLEAWVKRGAPDPRLGTPLKHASTWEEALEQRRRFWSLQPVRKPTLPTVKHGEGLDPVDRFLLAALEAKSLTPAPEADRRTLIRRLSLVLTGLPPTSAEIEQFVNDRADDACDRLVDRLLASPHYGERLARLWLDLVRFSETHGYEHNYEVHHAWRYRDYLTRAFNQDLALDRLIREHIAGDLLRQPRWHPDGYNESAIGTMFYRFGEINHDCVAFPQVGFDVFDNQIDTLTKAFQATTVACARCHDHKYDAVSTKDYHGILGILRNSRSIHRTIDAPEVNSKPMQKLRDLKAEMRKELSGIWLAEAKEVVRYLLAAQARLENESSAAELARGLDPARLERWLAVLKMDKAADPFTPWRAFKQTTSFAAEWKRLAESMAREEREHREFNQQHFKTFADFRSGRVWGWQETGHGLRDGPRPAGDFVVDLAGDAVLKTVLPAGYFSHTLSGKLNGSLRSGLLPSRPKYISFEVAGQHNSTVRLVVNNCQLAYKSARYLNSDRLQWLTFEMPEHASELHVYAELCTMFDNPKFPDPIGVLAKGKSYRIPWDQAAADPYSFFGITRVVLHDGPEPPREELSPLLPLFASTAPTTRTEWATRYTTVVEKAVEHWSGDRATDDDVRWLDALLQHGLLSSQAGRGSRLAELSRQYRATEKELVLPRIIPSIEDFEPGFDQPVYERGEWNKPSEEKVPRHYLAVLSKPGEHFKPTGSGRLELAERIASADNPLTARVMVNRIWQHLFGAGLVRTVDDFGQLGEQPSPQERELLDYLAARFVEEGWSVKRMIRTLVLTRAFRRGAHSADAARTADPQNRLLHRYPARRMDAETVRDGLLTISGRLDRKLFGPSIEPYRSQEIADKRLWSGPLDGHGRRSLYLKNTLLEGPRFLEVFNFPGGKVAQGRRDVTNVPAQALAMLNDPFVLQASGVWAERLVKQQDKSPGERIAFMFRAALGRAPTAEEQQRCERLVTQLAQEYEVSPEKTLASADVWKAFAHTIFNWQEFIFIP
jgi:hypothetical protein